MARISDSLTDTNNVRFAILYCSIIMSVLKVTLILLNVLYVIAR